MSNPTPTISSSLQPRLPIEQRIEDHWIKVAELELFFRFDNPSYEEKSKWIDFISNAEDKYFYERHNSVETLEGLFIIKTGSREYILCIATEYLAEYKADYVYKLMSEQGYSEKAAKACAYLELGY
jgi:hypothetical protein